MTTAVVVALVAAVASLLGATLALAGAHAARRSADNIDRRRHLITALDDDRRTLSDALASFLDAVGSTVTNPRAGRSVAFSAEFVLIHPRTSDGLADAVATVTNSLIARAAEGNAAHSERLGLEMDSVRFEAQTVMRALAAERAATIGGLPRR